MQKRKPSLGLAAAILVVVAAMIASSAVLWEVDIHIALILGAIIAGLCGIFILKFEYADIEKGIIEGIMTSLQANLILWTVGVLIGVWISSGVVPSMIYYGLNVLNPSIFLFATLFICSVVSLATGTSWGTSGTVGIALMGIALGLGIPAPVTAGVIISGAYFGDKMSPLSDTTNLAPAVAGTDLFQHIRAMCWTTGPTYVIVAAITLILGFNYSGGSLDINKISALQAVMAAEFWISPITFLAPIAVIGLSALRKPALPSLWAGIFIAVFFMIARGSNVPDIINAMQNGYVPTLSAQLSEVAKDAGAFAKLMAENSLTLPADAIASASESVVSLMERGGLQSMNWTISLIVCAFTFGSVMEVCGFLNVILETIMKSIKSVGGLIAAVIGSCFFCAIFLGDQYLGVALPGRMFKSAFDNMGLHPRMLSRSLEDAGTLMSVLIPWNTCGAYHTTVLGVSTWQYAPYAFLNYLNPLVAIIMTYMGIGIFWRGKNGEPVKGGKTRPADLV